MIGGVGLGEQACPHVAADRVLGRLADLLVEAGVEDVLLHGLRDEGAHLREHLLDHEGRRHDAFLFAFAHAFQHLAELHREFAQPRHVVLAFLHAVDRMLGGHERRQFVLRAEQLVQGIVVVMEAVALDLDGEEVVEHVVGQPGALVECAAIVAAQRGEVVLELGAQGVLVRERGIGEIVGIPVQPRRQHAQAAEQLRILHRIFAEHALEEPAYPQRLEIEGVHDQQGAQQQRQQQQADGPAEEGAHGRTPRMAARNLPPPGLRSSVMHVMPHGWLRPSR